ncbi:MAG: hypothetical protein QW128_06105 [Thermoprotei archaeon]
MRINPEKAEKICIKAEAHARELLVAKLGKGHTPDFFIIISYNPELESFEVDIEVITPKVFNINVQKIVDDVVEKVFIDIDRMVNEDC